MLPYHLNDCGSLLHGLYLVHRLCKEIDAHRHTAGGCPSYIIQKSGVFHQTSCHGSSVSRTDNGKFHSGASHLIPIDVAVPLGNIDTGLCPRSALKLLDLCLVGVLQCLCHGGILGLRVNLLFRFDQKRDILNSQILHLVFYLDPGGISGHPIIAYRQKLHEIFSRRQISDVYDAVFIQVLVLPYLLQLHIKAFAGHRLPVPVHDLDPQVLFYRGYHHRQAIHIIQQLLQVGINLFIKKCAVL